MDLQLQYNEDVCQVKQVVFGILSPARIKEKAVCEIYKHITNIDNKEGTLMDPRLGPIERGVTCPTCGFTSKTCPGHFGYLVLAKPVIQIQYYDIIIKLLTCFCSRCSAILIPRNDEKTLKEIKNRKGKARFDYVINMSKKGCFICGAMQPIYKKHKNDIAGILAQYKKLGSQGPSIDQVLNPEMIHTIFKNVTDEDVDLIGLDHLLSRPEWMIWTIMPIPPPAMRPWVKSDAGKTNDDDLTHKLNTIIKWNNQLRIKLLDPANDQKYTYDWWQIIQYHVATYIDNERSGIVKATHRSGRPLKTIRQRIKAKEGRIRGNLMGKRVNGSARTVITAEPSLSMDQIGVPIKIAMNLTYPEIVTELNIGYMTQLVRNGPNQLNGAKSYQHLDAKKNLRFFSETDRQAIHLTPGDIVYRHLMDNDWVLFNRQPSLHKMSMMAHRVKVLDGKTFRLNVNVTQPYNGDFDGKRGFQKIHRCQQVDAQYGC